MDLPPNNVTSLFNCPPLRRRLLLLEVKDATRRYLPPNHQPLNDGSFHVLLNVIFCLHERFQRVNIRTKTEFWSVIGKMRFFEKSIHHVLASIYLEGLEGNSVANFKASVGSFLLQVAARVSNLRV